MFTCCLPITCTQSLCFIGRTPLKMIEASTDLLSFVIWTLERCAREIINNRYRASLQLFSTSHRPLRFISPTRPSSLSPLRLPPPLQLHTSYLELQSWRTRQATSPGRKPLLMTVWLVWPTRRFTTSTATTTMVSCFSSDDLRRETYADSASARHPRGNVGK